MLKKTIEYLDVDGNKVSDTFYFHLSKAEITEMELRANGNLAQQLVAVVQSRDGNAIVDTFQDLLKRAYGVRSSDGKRFIKSDEVWTEFTQTDAYSELFMALVTQADAASEFVRGIVPPDLAQKIDEADAQTILQLPDNETTNSVTTDKRPAWEREGREPTQQELMSMTPEQLRAAYAKKLGKQE